MWRFLPLLIALLLPVSGVVELVLAQVQHRRVPTKSDWNHAAAAALAQAGSADIVLVSPRWAEPLGRMALGAGAQWSMVGRSDLDDFARVFELSIRNEDDPDVARFSRTKTERFGFVELRVFENPSPAHALFRLSDSIGDEPKVKMAVGDDDKSTPCLLERGGFARMPALFAGPSVSGAHLVCEGSTAGPTIVTDLSYTPRKCLFLGVPGNPGESLRITATDIPFGKTIVGHFGLHAFAERELKFHAINVQVFAGGVALGTATHNDGDAWKRFEFASPNVAGRQDSLEVRVWADVPAERRPICLEIETRQ